MPNWVSENFSQGQVDSADRSELKPGELQTSTGAYYKRGDAKRIHKQGGRTAFGDTGSAAKVLGLYLAGFDTATDLLLAYSGTTLYMANAGATGTFSSLVTGLSASASKLCGAHYNDRHYLCNGYDTNRVVESDGTSRVMGMEAPKQAPPATASAGGGAITRPAEPSGDLVDSANTMDADLGTYGYMTLSAAGSATDTFSGGAWTGAAYGAAQTLIVKWALAGVPVYGDDPFETYYVDDTGALLDAGRRATVKIELSTNAGTAYTTILNQTTTGIVNPTDLQYPIAAAVDPDNVRVRVTLTYLYGTKDATLNIYDVRIQSAAAAANFSTTTGVYYGLSEYDQTRGLESPVVATELVTVTTQNCVTLTLPSSTQNTHTTHWRIYRTTDGGTVPNGLGLLGTILATQTSYIDDFQTYDKDTQAYPLVQLLTIDVADGTLRIPADSPPPSLRRIRSFRGFLVGLTRDDRRELWYCFPGKPESWPELYRISSFPLEEHDELVDVIEVGGSLLIFAKGAVLRTSTLPRVVQGSFDAADVSKIQGAPGLASEYGLSGVSVAGEEYAAWISHYGIYVTNGATFYCISDEIGEFWNTIKGYDKSKWVLHYDRNRMVLVFAYSNTSGGENDRYYFFHLAPEHIKDESRPRITGPHYGEYAHLCSGQVSNAYRLYSAHTDDGYVYLEDSGATDASLSYDASGTWPFVVKTRRVYGDGVDWAALRARLRHSAFGTGETVTVAWTTGRDTSGTEQTRSQSVSVATQTNTLFDVARGGEWHEVSITHTGSAGGSLSELQVETRGLGEAGKVSST